MRKIASRIARAAPEFPMQSKKAPISSRREDRGLVQSARCSVMYFFWRLRSGGSLTPLLRTDPIGS
jgi:hypothetical protein